MLTTGLIALCACLIAEVVELWLNLPKGRQPANAIVRGVLITAQILGMVGLVRALGWV